MKPLLKHFLKVMLMLLIGRASANYRVSSFDNVWKMISNGAIFEVNINASWFELLPIREVQRLTEYEILLNFYNNEILFVPQDISKSPKEIKNGDLVYFCLNERPINFGKSKGPADLHLKQFLSQMSPENSPNMIKSINFRVYDHKFRPKTLFDLIVSNKEFVEDYKRRLIISDNSNILKYNFHVKPLVNLVISSPGTVSQCIDFWTIEILERKLKPMFNLHTKDKSPLKESLREILNTIPDKMAEITEWFNEINSYMDCSSFIDLSEQVLVDGFDINLIVLTVSNSLDPENNLNFTNEQAMIKDITFNLLSIFITRAQEAYEHTNNPGVLSKIRQIVEDVFQEMNKVEMPPQSLHTINSQKEDFFEELSSSVNYLSIQIVYFFIQHLDIYNNYISAYIFYFKNRNYLFF